MNTSTTKHRSECPPAKGDEIPLGIGGGIKEHPILFSTPIVQAILAGTKTQTRRTTGLKFVNENPDEFKFIGFETNPKIEIKLDIFKEYKGYFAIFQNEKEEYTQLVKCPYGQPGDLLWVRETFKYIHFYPDNGQVVVEYRTGEQRIIENFPHWILQKNLNKWKPSIHMPKAVARLWLNVEGERVERLESISNEDAKAEGINYSMSPIGFCGWDYQTGGYNAMTTPRSSFMSLWRKVHGIERYGETGNPWVWVVKFKELSRTGRPEPETCNAKSEKV